VGVGEVLLSLGRVGKSPASFSSPWRDSAKIERALVAAFGLLEQEAQPVEGGGQVLPRFDVGAVGGGDRPEQVDGAAVRLLRVRNPARDPEQVGQVLMGLRQIQV